MKQIVDKNKKANILLGVLVCLIVTLFSGHALQTILTFKDYLLFAACGVAVFCLVIQPSFWRLDLPKAALMLFLAMAACTFIATLGSGLWFYLIFVSLLVVAYAVAENFTFETIMDVYLKIMTVTSIIALIGYVLLQNTTLLKGLPILENHNNIKYGVGVLFNYVVHEPDRNCAMFWEPGLFATHLTIAMVFEMLRPQKTNVLRILLFSLCFFTANSSAGFVLWFLCMLLFWVKHENRKLGPIPGIVSLLLVCFAIAFLLNFDSFLVDTGLSSNEYFSKLSSNELSNSSRVNAFAHNWDAFLTEPVFGIGYAEATAGSRGVANTSTSTFLLSVFGLPGLLYTGFLVYGVLKLKGVNWISKIVLLVIALIIVNKEPHDQILFTWCLLFCLLKQVSLHHGEKKKRGGQSLEHQTPVAG